MEVTDINVIGIYVTDLQIAKDFYVSKLGFKESDQMDPGILLCSNNVSIYLEPGRSKKNDPPIKSCEVSPCFATKSIKESYEELKNNDITIVSDYVEYGPEFAMFKIVDPDGNVLEFAGQP